MASVTNFTKQPYADEVGPRKIKSIQFSTFSGTEVMNAAEVQVHKPVFYEINREPVAHGLLDRRMSCAHILLPENERKALLKSMRNPRLEALQKKAYLKKDKDILYLYDRPEKLLITTIPVPPTPIRPSAFVDSGSMSNENDITSRLKTILQINNAVRLQLQDGNTQACMFGNREHIAEELKHGCIVERHLEDGDAVLFNRQPSLHRMSIMCHRAKIMPWRTLRFNESVCNPYNADFDGDEMNLHIPQTEEARAEALMLMGVQNNLCTPKNGQILVASTQDFLTSSFLITRKDTFYDRAAFSLMCSYMGDAMDPIDLPTPALLKPMELWTGKQLFSVLIRPHASMRVYVNLFLKEKNCMKNRGTMCPNDGFVYIRNSELLCGQVGKATLEPPKLEKSVFVDRSSWKLPSLNAVEVPASFAAHPCCLGIRAAASGSVSFVFSALLLRVSRSRLGIHAA
ncbi:DNA-directed RNA polymerase III subunit 1 [Nymphaea thermarum]|nr:DNA-directed RNA polymerase III subunit 1 [Nymphaea thermarum]